MTRAVRFAYWFTPVAYCFILYWLGLRTWFQQDDFTWLSLRNQVVDTPTLFSALFAPMAQGTIRPFSERAFFLIFSYFFGLHSFPYHLWVFLNQALNVMLVTLISLKLTGSRLAGFLAPLLWLSNVSLIVPMSYASAYNEIQYATFLLLGFYLFIRYTESGDRRMYWAQWVVFVLGFGSLELNMVYPALAALYALFFARRYLRSTLPMLAVSACYLVILRMLGKGMGNYYYDLNFRPTSILTTLARQWAILSGIPAYGEFHGWPPWTIPVTSAALAAVILGFTVWQARKKQFLCSFLLGWFLVMLSPTLPLHNRVAGYYSVTAGIGIAILAALALSAAWQKGWPSRASVAGIALLYVVASVLVIHHQMAFLRDRAVRARNLIQEVAAEKRMHPGRVFLLSGIDDDLFWTTLYYRPFRLFGWTDVFLSPDSRGLVQDDPHFPSLDSYFLTHSAARKALDHGALEYSVSNGQFLLLPSTKLEQSD